MWEQIFAQAASNGLWALLFCVLLVYQLKESRAREQQYRQIIKSLSSGVESLSGDIKQMCGSVKAMEAGINEMDEDIKELDRGMDQIRGDLRVIDDNIKEISGALGVEAKPQKTASARQKVRVNA